MNVFLQNIFRNPMRCHISSVRNRVARSCTRQTVNYKLPVVPLARNFSSSANFPFATRETSTMADAHPSAGTILTHGGEHKGKVGCNDAITTPVIFTSAYSFKNTDQLIEYCEGDFSSYEYGRYGNPTTKAAEDKLKLIEGGEDCLFSASGMSSATTMILALVPAGGRIITTRDCYRRTRQFMEEFLPSMGITVKVIDMNEGEMIQNLRDILNDGGGSLFFSETPTNPYLRCIDVAEVSRLCREAGCITCVDSTFASPVNMRPLQLGADLALHSATKFLGGHNDVLAGAVVGRSDLIQKIRALHGVLGGVLDPHAAYLVLRGMKTLKVRVKQHNETAMEIAQYLANHECIERVYYPGLSCHPDHEVAVKQMSGFGGVVSFEVKGDRKKTSDFIDALDIPFIAPSLGGVESLIEQPMVISYWDVSPEKRKEIGIKDSLVRYSTGMEDVVDVIADFEQAFKKIS